MKPLTARQVCLFFIAFIPINKLFLLPSLLARTCAEDMWLCTLFNTLIDLLTLACLLPIAKNCNKTIYQIVEDAISKKGAKIVFFIYSLFFILKSILPIIEEKAYIEITLYEVFPKGFMFLPFFVVAFYLCIKNLQAVGRTADIVWFSTLVGVIILFALSVANCDLSSLLPVGANGPLKTLEGGFKGFIWHGDCVYFAFFLGRFNCNKKEMQKIFWCFLLSCLLTVGFMVMFYGIFKSIAHRQIFALTDISKYSTVISNIARFDYFGIMAILFSGIFSLTVPLYFATECFSYTFNFKTKIIPAIIVNGVVLFITLFLREYFYSLEKIALSFGSAISFALCNFAPVFIPLLLKRRVKHEPQKN